MEKEKQSPWSWIPTLYVAEGLPFVTVTIIASVMYKRLGMSNTEVTFYTSLIALPWIFKPFWTPIVEAIGTKRNWCILLQLFMALSLLGVAFAIGQRAVVGWSLACFAAFAFCSATHSIAASSYYNVQNGLHPTKALANNLRRGFFHLSGLAGSGLMVMLAGGLETYHRHIYNSWGTTFLILSILFGALFLYHLFMLPHSADDRPVLLQLDYRRRWSSFWENTVTFFQQPRAIAALLFLVFFRLPEALVMRVTPLFLLDTPTRNGLGLSTQELGFASGTVGVIALAVGGLLGAKAIARKGFGPCFWPMVLLSTLPKVLYLLLCMFHVGNFAVINLFIFIEQFGCGFGFAAYTFFIPYLARNAKKPAHQAVYAAVVALSLHAPGFVAGWLQETVGYHDFFLIVMACSLVTFAVSAGIKVAPHYGKKQVL